MSWFVTDEIIYYSDEMARWHIDLYTLMMPHIDIYQQSQLIINYISQSIACNERHLMKYPT